MRSNKTVFLFLITNTLFSIPSTMAEDVRIRSQFPSPYGVYNQVSSTGNSSLAETSGNVQIANAAGSRVAVCSTVIENPQPEKTFGLRMGNNPLEQAQFSGNGGGITGGCFNSSGGIQSGAGAVTRTLALNPFGGNVAVGTTAANYSLHISGPHTNAIGIDNGANAGPIRYIYDGAGTFDHAYAP